jgi:hypothetical protein
MRVVWCLWVTYPVYRVMLWKRYGRIRDGKKARQCGMTAYDQHATTISFFSFCFFFGFGFGFGFNPEGRRRGPPFPSTFSHDMSTTTAPPDQATTAELVTGRSLFFFWSDCDCDCDCDCDFLLLCLSVLSCPVQGRVSSEIGRGWLCGMMHGGPHMYIHTHTNPHIRARESCIRVYSAYVKDGGCDMCVRAVSVWASGFGPLFPPPRPVIIAVCVNKITRGPRIIHGRFDLLFFI